MNAMSYCSSPPNARGFKIYEETGQTPAQAGRPAASSNHHLSLHTAKQANSDKENQFMAAAAVAALNLEAEEEPMAVDFVSVCLWC